MLVLDKKLGCLLPRPSWETANSLLLWTNSMSSLKLSNKAISDLRIVLQKSYGKKFEISLSDEEVNDIGYLLLTILAENLKIEIANPELSIPVCK